MKLAKIGIVALLLMGLAPAVQALQVSEAAAASQFEARFVQNRSLPGFDEPLTSQGIMRFNPDGDFHWEITQPYRYVFAIVDGVAHEELPDGSRRVLQPDETPWLKIVQRIFVQALSGHPDKLKDYFQVHMEELPNGRKLTLEPTSKAMAEVMQRIVVTEDAPGKPRHLVVTEAGGGVMDIRFLPMDTPAGSP